MLDNLLYMKKSIVVLIVLIAIYLAGFLGNIAYTYLCYSRAKWRIEKTAELTFSKHKINVVVLGNDSQIGMLDIENSGNPHWTLAGDTASLSAFCRAFTIQNDTLYVAASLRFAATDTANIIHLNLPYVNSMYCNGKLVDKKFKPQRKW